MRSPRCLIFYNEVSFSPFNLLIYKLNKLNLNLTDLQTEFSSLDRVCIPCSAVKIDIEGADTIRYSDIETIPTF